jgi:hypothetical protein
MKKALILTSLIIVIVMAVFGINYYRKNQLPEYMQIENKPKTEEEKREYLKKFESKPEDNPIDESGVEYNSGGFEGVMIEGLDKISSKISIEDYVVIDETLHTSFTIANAIIQDINNNINLDSYFEKNKGVLLRFLGIANTSEFQLLINNLKLLNGTITNVKVKSCEHIGNYLNIKVEAASVNNSALAQTINIVKTSSNNYMVIWE